MRNRLLPAMLAYAVLGLLVAFTLRDRRLQILVWIVLGALAVKTWVAGRMRE